MKVLVVGGAGYIGGAVTDLLTHGIYPGGDVRVYDSLVYEESYRKPVPFVRGDVRDRTRLMAHLEWADAVIWLAAIVGDAACALDPALTREVNRDSVKWLAENFNGRIVFMSTCSVYGMSDELLTEESPTNPLSVYAETKLEAESYLKDKNAIVFRLGTLFGLSDTYSRVRFDLAVNTMTYNAHTHGKLTVFGGEQYRPLLHVRDAAAMAVQAVYKPDVTGIFNLAEANWRIGDLARLIYSQFPGIHMEHVKQKFEDNRNYRVNSFEAARSLRFRPKLSVYEGVEEIKTLLSEGRLADPSSPLYWNDRHLKGKER